MVENTTPSYLVCVSLFGEFRVERRLPAGTWETVTNEEWGGHTYSRSLLKWLLCISGRRALRGTLLDALWPEMKSAETVLTNAVSNLRQVLGGHDLLRSFGLHQSTGYELGNQSLIWADSDACNALLVEAENVGSTSLHALPLLEEAFRLFNRGSFLESDGGLWCHTLRIHQEKAKKRCLLWLTEGYEAQKKIWQARAHYCHLLDGDPLDEDILRRFLAFLHRNGMTKDALDYWQEAQARFQEQGLSLSSTSHQLVKKIGDETQSVDVYLTSIETKTDALFSQETMLTPKNIVGSPVTVSCDMTLYPPLWERLSRTLVKSSRIDEASLRGLEQITRSFWQLRLNFGYKNLLSSFLGHLETVVQLLQCSHTPSTRKRLCIIASDVAQRVGAIYFDMNDYITALAYYNIALKAAREAENTLLLAIGLGRMSSLPIYSNHPQEALPLLQEAQHLATLHSAATISAWLASLEAEAHANLSQRNDCLQSLEQASYFVEQVKNEKNAYDIKFGKAKFMSYKGTCHTVLQQPEEAIKVFTKGVNLASMTPRHQAIVTVDLAVAYRQLGEIEEACKLATQALIAVDQTESRLVIQRLLSFHRKLKQWRVTDSVKNFDKQLVFRGILSS